MLVLSRKVGERVVIGENVIVQVLAVRRGQIRLGITAPTTVSIRREELPRLASGQQGPHGTVQAEEAASPTREERVGPFTRRQTTFAP